MDLIVYLNYIQIEDEIEDPESSKSENEIV